VGFINSVLGTPFGFVIYFAYRILDSYGLAILALAIIAKIPMFPVMLMAHRNSIRLLQLQPALSLIKQRHAGDKGSLSEAQYELFSKEKYSPLMGMVPLFVQLLFVIGMLQVMYHPLQHILRFEPVVIDSLVLVLRNMYNTEGSFAEQLLVLEAFQRPENRPVFHSALAGFHDGERIFQQILGTELHFLGLNLGISPSFVNPSPELVIILLSGIAALSFCLVQNTISPGALSQSRHINLGLTIFTVGLSLYFAFALPVGVGLYWTVGNFAAIGVVLLLNLLYPPKKFAADALVHLQITRKTTKQSQMDKLLKKEQRDRERADAARFRTAKKQVVFYAISGGQYKFYKTIIDYLVEHSDLVIHYLTNDPKDALFSNHHSQVIPYYASQQKTIALMLKLDTDIMVTTVPDLQSFHIKRSIVRDDIEYIHTFHGPTSTHLVYREKAFDHFDTLLCVGPHQVAEIRRREVIAKLPRKKLVKVGYGLYDQLATSYEGNRKQENKKPRILIAPSWQVENILDICIDSMLESLVGQGYEIVVRPHPQYVRLFPERVNSLKERFSKIGEAIFFELDYLSSESIFTSDLLVTDWSNIGYEFAYCTLKPCIFINTPMKVMNPNYTQYGMEPLDISLRDKVGVSIDIENVGVLCKTVEHLLLHKNSYKNQIKEIIQQYLYNPGRSGEAGGVYIIKQLESR
jgi:YidC/Oxa1 family membrane protein insertase